MKIVFFGGTFDPPHNGHLALAEAVLNKGIADHVMFVPAWIPPHKILKGRLPYPDRLKMMELAVGDRNNMSVSGLEGERGGVSYTIDSLEHLSEAHPEHEYILLIGGDSLAQLHTWHRAGELAEKFRIIFCPRPGETPDLDELLKHWPRNIAEKLLSGAIADLPLSDLASTGIRQELQEGKVPSGIADQVMDYIRQRRFYMNEETKAVKPTAKELACFCANVADQRKATDVIVLEMTELSAIADYFVICTGTSAPHLRAISENIQKEAREKMDIRGKIDGTPESNWIIVDMGDVMIHIFTPESRMTYQLEDLWGDAVRIDAVKKEEKQVKSRLI
ncbi:MAG: nicotinate (nicotinamide) nucleotide adenylyltransferase [Lentisphaeria bacterium]|nr:nicotinate (nicotinamide) nucleotide adenylyltransferase [Lentisphaeria bacterium]